MTPIEFNEQTVVFAKDQPEYLPLPAHVDGQGIVTSCWRLGLRERLRLLFTGRLWLQQMAFGQPLQPQRPTTEKPV